MAKQRDPDLFDTLRARGLRKRVAGTVAGAIGTGGRAGGKSASAVRGVVADLRKLADDIEDRATGGPEKRRASAKKAAATRKRAAAKRSAAAKKGARTRAKKAS